MSAKLCYHFCTRAVGSQINQCKKYVNKFFSPVQCPLMKMPILWFHHVQTADSERLDDILKFFLKNIEGDWGKKVE